MKLDKKKINISEVEVADRKEFYINIDSDIDLNNSINETIAQLDVIPLSHFVFGNPSSVNTKSFTSSPLTCLTGNGNDSKGMISSQIIAVNKSSVQSIFYKGQLVGHSYEDQYARYIRLVALLPDDLQESRENQTVSLLNNMRDCLQENGMAFKNVIRTWFYLDDLLDWYDEFNVYRSSFFEQENIFDNLVPASTGIGTTNSCGAEIIGDLIAILPKSDEVKIAKAKSPLQGSALDYRSSFSRGIEINLPSHNTLYISGTASINTAGDTVFLDDIEKQVDMTMKVVTGMLTSANMNWNDVKRGIAYFKSYDYVEYYIQYCKKHNINRSATSVFIADVCRDNLLFEIEIDAIKLSAKNV